MKMRNYLTVLFAVLAIVLLIALAGFMTVYVADESNPLRQQIMRILSPGESEGDTPASETSSEQAVTAAVQAHSFIFVGDSRTIGMRDAVNDACVYIGAEGEGYEWFADAGLAALDEQLAGDPRQNVILNLGVNDPKNISLYIDLYRSLPDRYPDTSFYILSVNPLVDSENFNTTNKMISLFNATMQSAFPDNYLDSFSYLEKIGFETVDGLHYTEKTYQAIHNFVVDELL